MDAMSKLLDSKLSTFLEMKILPAIKTIIQPIVDENQKLVLELAEMRRELKEARLDFEEDIDRRTAEADDETRRNNLVFHGLDSSASSAKSAAVEYIKTLDCTVVPEDIVQADRIGGKNTVVQFRDSSKKKEVSKAKKSKHESDGVSVKSDYCPRSRRARGLLFAQLLDLKNRQQITTARLVGGRVTVGQTDYFLHERRGCIEKRERGSKSAEFIPIPPRQTDRREPSRATHEPTVQPRPSADPSHSQAPSLSSVALPMIEERIDAAVDRVWRRMQAGREGT